MKKLMLAIAAVGAMFTATAASALPHKDTPKYFGVTATPDYVVLLSDSVESKGKQHDVWALMFFRHQQSSEYGELHGMWLLNRVDCATASSLLLKTELYTDKGDVNFPNKQTPKWERVKAGTPMADIYRVVCLKDHSKAAIMSASDTAKLLMAYRAGRYD